MVACTEEMCAIVDEEYTNTLMGLGLIPICVSTIIPSDVKDILDQIVEEDDTTITQFLRDMIDDYIEQRGV